MASAAQIKFSPERCDRIVGLLGEGNYPDVAAKAVGVNPKTVRRWTACGRTEDDRIEAGGEPDPDEAAYRISRALRPVHGPGRDRPTARVSIVEAGRLAVVHDDHVPQVQGQMERVADCHRRDGAGRPRRRESVRHVGARPTHRHRLSTLGVVMPSWDELSEADRQALLC